MEWARELVTSNSLALSLTCGPLAVEAGLSPLELPADVAEVVRAETDAAVALLYGMSREAFEFMLDSFAVLIRMEFNSHGEYRTKRLILENYDRMQECIDNGTEFVSTLDPAPGLRPRHPERTTDA